MAARAQLQAWGANDLTHKGTLFISSRLTLLQKQSLETAWETKPFKFRIQGKYEKRTTSSVNFLFSTTSLRLPSNTHTSWQNYWWTWLNLIPDQVLQLQVSILKVRKISSDGNLMILGTEKHPVVAPRVAQPKDDFGWRKRPCLTALNGVNLLSPTWPINSKSHHPLKPPSSGSRTDSICAK